MAKDNKRRLSGRKRPFGIARKRFAVLGAGRTGLACVDFLLGRGGKVTLYDDDATEKPVYDELRRRGVTICAGELPPDPETFDLAIISPGIPLTSAVAQAMAAADVPVWGEMELASRFIDEPIIAITGTNGKTTTTTLIGEILTNADYNVFVGGNIGTPLIESIGGNYDFYVVEVSSFQLESVHTFDATIALYLNFAPDHIDRHGGVKEYMEAKARLTMLQSPDHVVVINYDDPCLRALIEETAAEFFFFSRKEPVYYGTSLIGDDRDKIYYIGPPVEYSHSVVISRREILLPGDHNLENIMGAVTVTMLCGIEPPVIADTLRHFRGVEHRLEFVAEKHGIRYYNDSKGTNPAAAICAVKAFPRRGLVLIAGGRNKGISFRSLCIEIKEHCRAVVLIGECAEELAEACRSVLIPAEGIVFAADMDDAVSKATALAAAGDVVLLSPATASFDMYANYAERGKAFKAAVKKLK